MVYRELMPDGTTRLTGGPTPVSIQDAEWFDLTYYPGWGDYGLAFPPARYCKFQGLVYIEGLATRTDPASVGPLTPFANLPDGYRPETHRVMATIGNAGGGAESAMGIYVTETGDIAVSTHGLITGGYVHLNITPFKAA